MFDTIHQYFLELVGFTHTHMFYFYWLPVMVCLFGLLRRSQQEYKKDVANRKSYDANPKNSYYSPTITVGTVIGRIVVSFLPIVNLYKSLFDFLPDMYNDVVGLFNDWFNIPLVPKREKAPVDNVVTKN